MKHIYIAIPYADIPWSTVRSINYTKNIVNVYVDDPHQPGKLKETSINADSVRIFRASEFKDVSGKTILDGTMLVVMKDDQRLVGLVSNYEFQEERLGRNAGSKSPHWIFNALDSEGNINVDPEKAHLLTQEVINYNEMLVIGHITEYF